MTRWRRVVCVALCDPVLCSCWVKLNHLGWLCRYGSLPFPYSDRSVNFPSRSLFNWEGGWKYPDAYAHTLSFSLSPSLHYDFRLAKSLSFWYRSVIQVPLSLFVLSILSFPTCLSVDVSVYFRIWCLSISCLSSFFRQFSSSLVGFLKFRPHTWLTRFFFLHRRKRRSDSLGFSLWKASRWLWFLVPLSIDIEPLKRKLEELDGESVWSLFFFTMFLSAYVLCNQCFWVVSLRRWETSFFLSLSPLSLSCPFELEFV